MDTVESELKDCITSQTASEILGVSDKRVLQMIYAGELEAWKDHGVWLLSRRHVESKKEENRYSVGQQERREREAQEKKEAEG